MADSSLDEFFAKKDKSKRNKSKSKFTTSDTIAKKLEEGAKKDYVKKDHKEKISSLSSTIPSSNSSNLSEQQDDEWKDLEDEKERDYSGLRIQALSISEKEKDDEQSKEQMIDENGEVCKVSESQSGPWKSVNIVAPIVPVEEPVIEKSPEPEVDPTAPKPSAYKIPALRNSSISSSNTTSSSRRHGSKFAPQISSEVHFPTLSSAVDSKGKSGLCDDRSFQSVKHGIKSKNETQHELQLDLENKFSALHHGDQY